MRNSTRTMLCLAYIQTSDFVERKRSSYECKAL